MLSQLLKPWQQLSKICLLLQKFPKQTVLEERFISESTQMRVVFFQASGSWAGRSEKEARKKKKQQRGDWGEKSRDSSPQSSLVLFSGFKIKEIVICLSC